MKKFNLGFTLAEVLITLSIIGVISAVVMPSVISSYQFKTIGVKLSKFASTVETAARSYVVQNDSFNPANGEEIQNFINEAFIFKSVAAEIDGRGRVTGLEGTGNTENIWADEVPEGQDPEPVDGIYLLSASVQNATADGGWAANAVLKDNTSFTVRWFGNLTNPYTVAAGQQGTDRSTTVDRTKVGFPVFQFAFNPQVTGMSSTVHTQYFFNVTELGYVFPAHNDECLWGIYDSDWTTNQATFRAGSDCNGEAAQALVGMGVEQAATGDGE